MLDVVSFFKDYPFLWNALIASLLVSLSAGIIGSLVVSSKNVFLTGGVAHGAFGGVGVALFFGFSTTLGASLSAIVIALVMTFVRLKYKDSLDSYVAALWALGMAVGVICMDLSDGYGRDLSSYLFGSIIAVSDLDLWCVGIFDAILLLVVSVYYREILNVLYDLEFCQLKGLNTRLLSLVVFIFIALGVVMSMSVAGLILVISILSAPAYIAGFFTSSLRAQMALSSLLCLVFIWLGFGVSYVYDLSVGACVVVVSVLTLFVVLWLRYFVRRG